MKESEYRSQARVQPDWSRMPAGTEDLSTLPVEVEAVRWLSKAKPRGKLPSFSRLRWAVIHFSVNEKILEQIAAISTLEFLYLDRCTAPDLSVLQQLPHLQALIIEANSKIETLESLAKLSHLKSLGVQHFSRVHDLSPLAALSSLEALAIDGSMDSVMRVESLEPVGRMKNLRYFFSSSLRVKENTLRPLGQLSNLEYLSAPLYYAVEEWGWLAGKLPRTRCDHFTPFMEVRGEPCKRCGKQGNVLLVGKRLDFPCKFCDAEKVRKHVDKFEKARDEATRS